MVKVTSLEGNSQLLDGGSMFGNAPRAVWQKWVEVDDLGRIPLACRSLLIEIGEIKIICETGIGAFFEPKLADRFGVQNADKLVLLENLKIQHINPDEIDFVILSHLHFDHAGGLLPQYNDLKAGDNSLNFKNAKYVVGEQAYKRSIDPHPRDRASFIPGLADKLKNSNRLIIVPDGQSSIASLPKEISFIYSQGHTPGQMLTYVEGQNESVLFTGDLVPGTHWVHLPITMGYDRFAEKVIDEKAELYDKLDFQKTWLFYTHDFDYVASKVELSDNKKYRPVNTQASWSNYTL